ncbi:MAG: DUF692 family protein [Blastocatellia bacterium]|nr:DUF692 family protein [Blastocatellia bacterium]
MKMNQPTPLGVGFTWQPDLKTALGPGWGLLDFLEISPDVLCREMITNGTRHLAYQPDLLQAALGSTSELPVVIHGLGLSIGSTTGWSEEYLRILDEFAQHQSFRWHSEHLAFMLTTMPDGTPLHTGIPLPMPFTDEAIDLIAPRATALGERYGVPFLLENLTYYLPGLPAEKGRDEIAFLNDLTAQSGCGLLLDLYNFYCNAVNFGFDPFEALSRLRMESVIEIHLAGGAAHDGFLTDIHTREVPEPVWELLEFVAPRAVNLAGIVYEVMEPAVPLLGAKRLTQQLARVRQIWDTHCAPSQRRSAYAVS